MGMQSNDIMNWTTELPLMHLIDQSQTSLLGRLCVKQCVHMCFPFFPFPTVISMKIFRCTVFVLLVDVVSMLIFRTGNTIDVYVFVCVCVVYTKIISFSTSVVFSLVSFSEPPIKQHGNFYANLTLKCLTIIMRSNLKKL